MRTPYSKVNLKLKLVLFLATIIAVLSGCPQGGSTFKDQIKTQTNEQQPSDKQQPEEPTTEYSIPSPIENQKQPDPPKPNEPNNPVAQTTNADFEPLFWERFKLKVPKAQLWSKMIYEIIEKKAPDLISQNSADDVELFCPKYRSLNDKQRLNFWAQLIVGIARFESSWRATSSTPETRMNSKDSVTGLMLASEGLLQLSYKDQKNYGLQCGFDWNKDKKYKSEDERKTILDPYKNLNCGIQIFAIQIRRFRKIVVTESRQLYWSVLYNGRSNKIKEISDITKSLSFCQ